MKIALINPPDVNRIFSEVPEKVNQKSGVLPPLGLLYLEAYLAEKTGHEALIIDCPADEMNYSQLEQKLKDFLPNAIGLTGHTHNLVDMLKCSELFKKINPDGVVIWGGAHVSAFPDQTASLDSVDFAVYGEGERTLAALLNTIEKDGMKNAFFSEIKGIVFRSREGKNVITPPAPCVDNLDELPHPRRQVLDVSKYFYTIGTERRASSFLSSRGCPYHCIFCSTPGEKFRWRSAKDTVDEIEECVNLGIEELYFVDDTFNVRQDRVIEICEEIIKRNIKISWNYRGRIDLVTEEQLRMAKKAGCTRIQLGVETGTDEGLKALKKGITADEVRKAFKLIRKVGITSVAYFMIGCPHEKTIDDVRKTIEFAKEINPDYVLFGILTPYPGTELYRNGVEKRLIDPAVWEDFVSNPTPGFRPPPWIEHFTQEELEALIDQAYKKFYGRPGYIMKRLLEIKNPGDLWRKVVAGLKVLK